MTDTVWFINRSHINPDSEEHAAMCAVSARVTGDFVDAKTMMADMVAKQETTERALKILPCLVAVREPVEIVGAYGSRWVGSTWTTGDVRWCIRMAK